MGAITGLILAVLLSGCAQGPARLVYGHQEARVLTWPSAPEPARYRFVGQLSGEQNLQRDPDALGWGRKALAWVVGLVSGPRRATILQRPQAGTVDDRGRILVTDVSRGAVYCFDETAGRLDLWEMADARTRFVTPVGIVSGAGGTTLVVDAELGRIVRLAEDGAPLGSFGSEVLVRPTGLARDAATGRVYVADTHAHDIKVFDDAGALIRTLGRRGEGPGEFNSPTYLAWREGRLYVTDTLNSRIQVFDADGNFLRQFGRRGLYIGDLPRPKGVAVDSTGNVYVVESYYDYLLVFNDKGELLLPIGGTGHGIGEFYLPAGVWTDARDRIYVADAFNGRVMIFQYMGDL